MPRSALVTGAAGFLGSHVSERLLADGWAVTGLDNFDAFYPEPVKRANLTGAAAHDRFRLVEADICDASTYDRLEGGYDGIVHLAARAGVRPSLSDPAGYQHVNLMGTQRLLEAARRWQTPQFVLASSSSVYGTNPDVPWDEGHALLPISPYASSKLSAEMLAHVYSHLYGIRVLALRFFTLYGPRQRPDLAIHKFAARMLAGEPIPVYGDGSSRRDYTFVLDAVEAVCGALAYRDSPFEVLNVGNDRTVGLSELIGSIEAALDVRARIDRQPAQPGDVPQTWARIDKARRLIGYAPQTALPEGLSAFAQWMRARPAS